jgi:hypothetical protein
MSSCPVLHCQLEGSDGEIFWRTRGNYLVVAFVRIGLRKNSKFELVFAPVEVCWTAVDEVGEGGCLGFPFLGKHFD